MKTILKVSLFCLMLNVFQSCSKDDGPEPEPIAQPEPEPIAQNNPPASFDLVAVTDNAVEVDVLPTFSWNTATDPDGDTVTYNLYLNTGTEANQLYAENLTETTFELTERLGLLENYTWRVEAMDTNGASVSSTSRSFSTRAIRLNETALTENAEFDNQFFSSSVLFDEKLWVIGGANDIWYSENGISWTLATSDAQFPERYFHTSVVFDNKIWVIGGEGANGLINDVWFSEDGIFWEEATNVAPFR